METLNRWDTALFLWLNGQHARWLDPVMFYLSDRNFWLPFYALFIGWLFWRLRRQAWGLLLAIALTVALGDQLTSSLLKPLTHRLRPCHEPAINQWVHVVYECGGRFGFASSHASNSFGFAMLMWLLLGRRFPALAGLFAWAAVVSYSRIYVGAHYPLDILAGTGIGTLSAMMIAFFYKKITQHINIHS